MIRITTTFTDTAGGGTKYNNLYFDAVDPADAIECKDQVVQFWSGMATQMHDGMTYTVDALVPVIESTTGDVLAIYNVGTTGGAGVSTSEPLPLSTQALVRLGSDGIVNNRRVKGRINIPGLTTTANSNGRLAAPTRVAIDDIANTQFTTTPDQRLVVWSRPRPADPENGITARAGSLHPVTSKSTWQEFAVLRSRRD